MKARGTIVVGVSLLGAIACLPTPDPMLETPTAVVTSPTDWQFSLRELEQQVWQQINQYRQSQNLPPLKLNAQISQQARQHSQAMAQGQVPFSHQGFEQRAKAIAQPLPYRRIAENVAFNQGHPNPAQQAVQGWLDSPGHLNNIRGEFSQTGIGVARNEAGEYYFTQIFVQPRSETL